MEPGISEPLGKLSAIQVPSTTLSSCVKFRASSPVQRVLCVQFLEPQFELLGEDTVSESSLCLWACDAFRAVKRYDSFPHLDFCVCLCGTSKKRDFWFLFLKFLVLFLN